MYNEIIDVLSSPDLIKRQIKIDNNIINIVFIETICDTTSINTFLLKYFDYLKIKNIDINKYIEDIPNFKIIKEKEKEEIINKILNGFVLIYVNNTYYTLEFRRQLDSGINIVENEKTLKGPKDSFTENYQTNIGLIRKRLKTSDLKIKELSVSKTNSKVAIVYIDKLANKKNVDKLIDKISSIDIDMIPNTNFIYEFLKKDNSLFKTAMSTERPDMVSYKLMSGKIAIIVENTPNVTLVPIFFNEYFHTMEDYYTNTKNATFLRLIRMLAFFVTVMLPGIYIATITYNHEIIPPTLLVNFAMQKDGVPFPTVLEALITNFTYEVLRETDARTPSTLGSALSIVGALVLGDAAVKASLVSPIMVIIISITAISELIFYVNELSNACKIYRLIFIFLASISGIIGIYIGLILLVVEISSAKSLGLPYIYPASPIGTNDMKDDIILNLKYKLTKRNKLTSKDTKRGNI